jgi:tetratricopeptide (TPR) repeat protein
MRGAGVRQDISLRDKRFGETNVTISIHQARSSAFALAAAVFVLLIPATLAQRYSPVANPDSQEAQFIDLINLQSEETKKLALLEQFTQRYPKHQAVSWAYEQLQLSAIQASQWDRALTFGEKLVQINPDDMDTAQLNIKAAESKGDRTTLKLWTDYASRVAQRILESPPPKDPEQLEEWKKRTAIASQYAVQDEYALYKKALESGDPRQQIKLLDELLKRNSDTTYLPQALVIYLNAYRATGDHRNALLSAERILKTDPNHEDALLTAAEAYLQRGSAPDKVLAYSARIVAVMNTKKKPAIVRQEDWDRKKSIYIGTAHWMIGNTFIAQNRFVQADTALRAALPMLRHNEQSSASILFYLGWANYKMENFVEAARFYKQCSVLHGQFQEQALKNLSVIRSEQGIQE